MLTQFLDETKAPLLYYDLMDLMREAGLKLEMKDFDAILYAGYKQAGRLGDYGPNARNYITARPVDVHALCSDEVKGWQRALDK